jgi:hypothetical protein
VGLETLVLHGLKALSTGVGNDEEITEKNIEVAHVGAEGFKLLKTEEIKSYLDKLQQVPAFSPVRSSDAHAGRKAIINSYGERR